MQKKPTTPETMEKLKTVLKQYIDRVDNTAYEGTILERVSLLVHDPSNNMRDNDCYYFHHVCIAVLKALTKRKVSEVLEKEIGESGYEHLVEMLDRMISFTEWVDRDRYRAELLLSDIELADPGAKALACIDSIEEMKENTAEHYIQTYSALLNSLKSEGKTLAA